MKLFSQLLVIPVIFTAIYIYFSKQPTIYNNEPQWIDLSAPRSEAILNPDSNRDFVIQVRHSGMNTAPMGMPIPDNNLVLFIEYGGVRFEADKSLTTVNYVVDKTLTFTIWNGKYSNCFKGAGPISVKVKTNSREFVDSSVFLQYKD
jgi:hypothetical protein